ncbi:MAG: glycosyltransferase family 4 protein [Candidatus Krumholzibacteria bacterium]|nr:glycosyltransferase family 4 protein [Candidatus Krumholzibacteria bacterium]
MKILFATEEISAHPSEGLLVFTMHLCRFLNSAGELTVLYASGDPEPGFSSLKLLSQRTLLTGALLSLMRGKKFDIVIYLPSSGLTAFGLGRGLLMRLLAKSPTIIIALQERKIRKLHQLISQISRPELVLSPDRKLRSNLDDIGLRTDFVMPGFDENLFRPVASEEKSKLRVKFNLPRDRFIVLHVGHIKESRNIQVFLRYREWGPDIQPVIKGGEVDPSWRNRLRMAGIIVIDEYLDDIHKLYQAADCYLFPVSCPTGALEFPLSVIEAAACNLPVLTTRFGALPETMDEGEGIIYFDKVSEIKGKLAVLRRSPSETRRKVKDFSWEIVFEKYLLPQMQSLAEDGKGA